MAEVFDGREDPLGDDVVNLPGIPVFKAAPAHHLAGRGLGEDFVHLLAGHVFKFFRL